MAFVDSWDLKQDLSWKKPPPAPTYKFERHVIGVFARVLERNRETKVTLGETSTARIIFRDNTLTMSVSVNLKTLSVLVHKGTDTASGGFIPQGSLPPRYRYPDSSLFFSFSCPVNRMGRLRKTALILQKKLQYVEIHEVTSS